MLERFSGTLLNLSLLNLAGLQVIPLLFLRFSFPHESIFDESKNVEVMVKEKEPRLNAKNSSWIMIAVNRHMTGGGGEEGGGGRRKIKCPKEKGKEH